MPTTNVKKNDYAFIVTVVSGGNPEYKRYKYNGTQWLEEFVLNNSSFTANQWAAINSGISSNWMNDTIQSINEETQARQDADNLIWEKLNKVTSQVQEITWAELKALRDNSNLTSGQFYRITDYQCTTVQSNTRSAGNQFDIIVLALTNNTLSEQAWAALHSGDTYFANSNLSAWKLWYCLDNDTTRFAWADNTSGNGRGVIYRMIDEFNNDVPYDFKNILMSTTYNISAYHYSFGNSSTDASLVPSTYNNIINPYIKDNLQLINRINIVMGFANIIKENCYNMVISNGSYLVINSDCNTFYLNRVSYSTIGNNCNNISNFYTMSNCKISNNCNNIVFNSTVTGELVCTNIIIESGCQYLKINYEGISSSISKGANIISSYIRGISTSPVDINISCNHSYETKTGLNSNGELKQWCEADLVQ